jgi:EAL domain-containing protein (putative c-di-GMP-specific phosphodiesterase class I)
MIAPPSARPVVRLGAVPGVAVVAEGFESAEIGGRPMALNCRFGHGSFYGRPEAAASLALRLVPTSLPAAA